MGGVAMAIAIFHRRIETLTVNDLKSRFAPHRRIGRVPLSRTGIPDFCRPEFAIWPLCPLVGGAEQPHLSSYRWYVALGVSG